MGVSYIAVVALGRHDIGRQLALPELLLVDRAIAGHADDENIFPLELTLRDEDDDVPYVAALGNDSGPSQRLYLFVLTRQVQREVVHAKRVPDEGVDISRVGYEDRRCPCLRPVPAVAYDDLDFSAFEELFGLLS